MAENTKVRRVTEFSQVLNTIIAGMILALLVSYGSDIKQINVLVDKVDRNEKNIAELQKEVWGRK